MLECFASPLKVKAGIANESLKVVAYFLVLAFY